MLIKDLGEERLIKYLSKRFTQRHPRLIKAIGDDASVTVQRGGWALLSTTDVLIEGVHFKKGRTPAYLLGKKALAISLSDIAAMGGNPLFYLVSIAVPPDTPVRFLTDVYRGMYERAKKCGAFLAGGNTARLPGRIVIETTVIGEAQKNRVVYRAGAKKGDMIFLTGAAGDSALGLLELKRRDKGALKGPFKKLALRHLDPEPRLEAGAALGAQGLISSMIDVSDGVLLDLKRLCAASGVSAAIDIACLPISKEFKRYEAQRRRSFATLALIGGEDYELLFTARPENEARVMRAASGLKLRITKIGAITGGPRTRVKVFGADGKAVKTKSSGYLHFRPPLRAMT
ncbi:MAG: thiamine-phosphate kinase [Deltaproteobacteria bacterium]|nr:thiamine-phosphate kinase [Deltaproteobacteria bacterium]